MGGTSLRVPQLAAWSTDLRCSQTDTRLSPASRILPQSRAFRLSGQIYKEQRESCRLILHPGPPVQPHCISLNEDRTDCRESILTESRPRREATPRFPLPWPKGQRQCGGCHPSWPPWDQLTIDQAVSGASDMPPGFSRTHLHSSFLPDTVVKTNPISPDW